MSKNSVGAGQLLAAVSLIGLSVGMVAAEAADNGSQGVLIGLSKQDKHATQIKGESHDLKYESSQIKLGSSNIKQDSTQQKGSSQLKLNSGQIKLNSSQIKLNPGQFNNSTQVKQSTASELNPQPEPPNSSPTGQ